MIGTFHRVKVQVKILEISNFFDLLWIRISIPSICVLNSLIELNRKRKVSLSYD